MEHFEYFSIRSGILSIRRTLYCMIWIYMLYSYCIPIYSLDSHGQQKHRVHPLQMAPIGYLKIEKSLQKITSSGNLALRSTRALVMDESRQSSSELQPSSWSHWLASLVDSQPVSKLNATFSKNTLPFVTDNRCFVWSFLYHVWLVFSSNNQSASDYTYAFGIKALKVF